MIDATRLKKIIGRFGGRAFIEFEEAYGHYVLIIQWQGRAGRAREQAGLRECFSERDLLTMRHDPFDEFEARLDYYLRRFDEPTQRRAE